LKIYDDLHAFYVTAKSTTISSAAKKLGIEQSSLSSALSRLEKKLGIKVIIRKRTGLELTPDGHSLFMEISPKFSDINSIISEFLESDTQKNFEEIRVLTTTGTLSSLIINVIEKFHNEFPNIAINLITYDGYVNFSEMNIDIGVLPTVIDLENVSKKKVATLKSQMFCSKEYVNRNGKPCDLEALKMHKFIGYYNNSVGYKGNVDWHLKYSLKGEAEIKINLASAQVIAAEKGLGIIAIPNAMPMSENMLVLFPETYVLIDVFSITKRGQSNSMVDIFQEYVKNYLCKEEKKP